MMSGLALELARSIMLLRVWIFRYRLKSCETAELGIFLNSTGLTELGCNLGTDLSEGAAGPVYHSSSTYE